MHFTLDEAADRVVASHKVMLRALETGKLGGLRTPAGEWLVDGRDLFEKYRALRADHGPVSAEPVLPIASPQEESSLLELLRAERSRVEELRAERDRWAALAERLALALSLGSCAGQDVRAVAGSRA